jgi:ComF family protein
MATHALDFVFPPRCLACGEDTDSAGYVCPRCWVRLGFVTTPLCDTCGAPFDYDARTGTLCGACVANPPPFTRARTALRYDDGSRAILVGLKHDRLHGVKLIAGWMARAGGEMPAASDIVCAVPLHRWRLLRRGYNQAALLAGAIAKSQGKRAIPDLLQRRRNTVSQGGLSRSGRLRNVRGAFRLNARFTAAVKGKTILLVDDVFTTGATLSECCRVLKKAGAAEVHVLTAARVF